MNKYTLGTIIGTAALGLAKSKLPFGNRNVFQNIGLPIWKQFEKANIGLKNNSIQGVEIAGDSFKLTPLLKDKSISSIITSPPYFQMRKYSESNQEVGQEKDREEYIKTLVKLFVDLMPKLKDDGVLVVNIDALSRFSAVKVMGIPYQFVSKMEEAGWTFRYDMKWIKPSFGGWRSTFSPGKNFEHIFGFIKSSSVKKGIKHYNYNQMHEKGKNQDWKLFTSTIHENGLNHRSWSNNDSDRFLERFNSKEDKILLSHLSSNAYMHGAPLNPRVAWILVQLFSRPRDFVLDPFSGSGTITKVSKLCGRKAIGFELEKVHSKLAVIGEAFTKNFDQIHKEYMRSGKDKAFGGKGVSQLTPIKPCISWKNYDSNKTMWIDASYLNISGSRSKKPYIKNKGSKAKFNHAVNLNYYKVDLWRPEANFSEWSTNIVKEHVQKIIDQIVVNVSDRYPNLNIYTELYTIRNDIVYVIMDIKEIVSSKSERVTNSNATNITDMDDEYFDLWMNSPDSLTKTILDASGEIEIGIQDALNLEWQSMEEFGASAEIVLISEKGEIYKPPKSTSSKLRKS